MKKMFFSLLIVLLSAFPVWSIDFVPDVLKLSVAPVISYDFDGSELNIPVRVNGPSCTAIFLVFTKDQGENIGYVQNGHLGWHQVNKIDTCIYMSDTGDLFDTGDNLMIWDGKDQDGNKVPKGEYTYYMYAFDSQHSRTLVTHHMPFGWNCPDIIQTIGEDGNPLTRPVIYGGGNGFGIPEVTVERIHTKWIIGSDPEDATLVETTSVWTFADAGTICLQPNDHSMWFKQSARANATQRIEKYKWVPNGESVLQPEWGDDGKFEYSTPGLIKEYHSGLVQLGETIYIVNQNFLGDDTVSELIYCDLDEGTEQTRVDISDIWVNIEDYDAGGQRSGGPHDIVRGQNGMISVSSHLSCLIQSIDPYKNEELGGTDQDITNWVNGNGDYLMDKNFETDAAKPWVCNDFNVEPWLMNNSVDANGFTMAAFEGFGSVSFSLFAPDGSGIGNLSFLGEAIGYGKNGSFNVSSGSAYDGIYVNNSNPAEEGKDWSGYWFVAQHSVKGTITNVVSVDDAPAAFTVAQNSPNPFNPTTTISFSLSEAGNVSIDVFNVAGQKVDTIANEFISAGSHSVTWDASGFSAGVYFYTVKSGDFSKTMKMTLLK